MAIDIENPGGDEAELQAAIKALANEVEVVTISADTTLSSTHYGKLIYVDTAGVDLTLPAAPATVEVIRVLSGAASTTVNSVAVSLGKDITYVSIGSAWKRMEPATSAATGIFTSGVVTGRYYPLSVPFAPAAGSAVTANTVYFDLFMLPHDLTASELVCAVTSAAGTNAYMAIYATNASTKKPTGTPIASIASAVSSASTGAKNAALSSNVALTAGTLYAAAICCDGAATFRANTVNGSAALHGFISALNGSFSLRHNTTSTPGTWPDMTSAGFSENQAIHVTLSAKAA